MRKILLSLLFLAILFGISRFIFEPTYLYYELTWLDIPMHILGGIGLAFLMHAIFTYNGYKLSLLKFIIIYSVIALCWEIYEYERGVMVYDSIYKWLDSLKDYIDGIIGVYIVYYFKVK